MAYNWQNSISKNSKINIELFNEFNTVHNIIVTEHCPANNATVYSDYSGNCSSDWSYCISNDSEYCADWNSNDSYYGNYDGGYYP